MTTLDRLISQFLDAQRDGNRARWRQADLATAVFAEAGSRGLAKLAQASGFSLDYLRMFVRTAAAFPPGRRRIELSFSHHRIAQRAAKRFPDGTREHDPQFWLDQAVAQAYRAEQLRRAMDHHVLAQDSLEARQAQAAQTVVEAQRYIQRLQAGAEFFNATYAVFWGARIVIIEQALLNPAS